MTAMTDTAALETGPSVASRPRRMTPYLVIGLLISLGAHLVLWFRFGAAGPSWLFLWAHSHLALVMLATRGWPWLLQSIAWVIGYLAAGALLWLLLERRREHEHGGPWLRALASWTAVEVGIGVCAWLLFVLDVLPME